MPSLATTSRELTSERTRYVYTNGQMKASYMIWNTERGAVGGRPRWYLKGIRQFIAGRFSLRLSLHGLLYSSMLLNHTNPKLSAVELKWALLWSVPLALELNFAYSHHLIQSLSSSLQPIASLFLLMQNKPIYHSVTVSRWMIATQRLIYGCEPLCACVLDILYHRQIFPDS